MIKKLLLVVILAIGCFPAFGQELKWGGSVESGVVFFFPDGGDPSIWAWTPRDGATVRAILTGSVISNNRTAGINFEMRSEAPFNGNTSSIYYESLRAWFNFWGRKFTIIAGKLDDNGPFRSYGGIDDENMAANDIGTHFRLAYLPFLPNLTLGFTVMPGIEGMFNTAGVMNHLLKFGNYRIGAHYLFEDAASILTLFYNDAQTETYGKFRLHSISAVNVLALKKFGFESLIADIGFYDMQDSDYSNMKIGQRITYRVGDFEIGGRFRQSLLLGDVKELATGYAPELLFHFFMYYTPGGGTIRAGLETGYLIGGFKGNPPTGPGVRSDGFESMDTRSSTVNPGLTNENDRLRGFRKDTAFLSIIPQVEFRIGSSGTGLIIGGGPLFDLCAGSEKYNYMVFANVRSVF